MIKTSFYNINPLDRLETAKPDAKASPSSASFFDTLKNVAQHDSVIQINNINSFIPIGRSSPRSDVQLEVPHIVQEHTQSGLTSLATMEKYYGLKP